MSVGVEEKTKVDGSPAYVVAKASGSLKGAVKETAKKTLDDVSMTPFLRKITFFASGGSLLDGYVLSLIGVALTQLVPAFGLSTEESAAIGASVLVGIFFGTILGGYVTDKIGRHVMFIVDVLAICVFSLWSVFATQAWEFVAARFFIGLFIGADYPIATSLIAEFAPKKSRSINMGIVSAAWYLGATVAAVVGYALYGVEDGWRWMLASPVPICVFLLIGRSRVPESPLWLIERGRVEEAHDVMKLVYDADIDVAVPESSEKKLGVLEIFRGGYLKRIVFLGILTLCQVAPMYAIYTFGPEIMTAFGLGAGADAILGESVVSLFFLIGSIPAMFWLNSMGRRPLLIRSLAMMALGLMVLGLFPDAPVFVVVVAFGSYAFFSGGPGILQWLYPNELFPTEVRATAVGIAIAFSRIGTVLATYATPLCLAMFGIGPTMLAAAALVVLGFALSVAMAPETRDMTLEESSSL